MFHRSSLFYSILVLAGVVTLSACTCTPMATAAAATVIPNAAAPTPPYPPSINQLVAAAKSQIKTMKLPEFKAALDNREVGLLIDVRNENEFADGFIPGAINIPRGWIEFRIWKLAGFPENTDMNTKMTLYCATGGRCALATKSLQDLGFTNVTAVDMRLEDWVKAGYPMVTVKLSNP